MMYPTKGLSVVAVLFGAAVAWPLWAAVPVDPPLDVSEAEVQWIQVGWVRPGNSCPKPADPGWMSRKLFPARAILLYPPLGSFCLYEWTGPGPANVSAVSDLLGGGILDAVESDSMIVTPAGSQLGEEIAPSLQAHYEMLVGHMTLPITGGQLVRLVLVDTSPTTGMNPLGLPETSPHGQTLRRLIEHLLCDATGRCAADIRTRLALAYKSFDRRHAQSRDVVRGGSIGTLSDLAEAIGLALASWDQDGWPPLVLNLSVAWDPLWGGLESSPQAMAPAVRAVYRVIEAATCHGVLVIAAAGNSTDRRGPVDGPLLPAAWTSRGVPAGMACPARAAAGQAPVPLLHAAGGVRASGEPLANARAESAPPLAAYADHVVVTDPGGTGWTANLVGSSVAASTVSAAAAAVLYFRPILKPSQVIDAVYRGGDLLERTADICPFVTTTPCPWVSYVSLCGAVEEACKAPDADCPQRAPCEGRSFEPVTLEEAELSGFGGPATHWRAANFSEVHGGGAQVCGAFTPLYDPTYMPGTDPCPSVQRYGLGRKPWTQPQPNADPCPDCVIIRKKDKSAIAAGTLYLTIDPRFTGALNDPALTICTDSDAPITYQLNCPGCADGLLRLEGLPIGSCEAAELSFTYALGESRVSVSSSLLVSR